MSKIIEYGIQCIKDEAEATLGLLGQIDESFEKAVDMMYHCHGDRKSVV